jgi:hypothetical protein
MVDVADHWLWGQQVFCANTDCVLHVVAGSPGVEGNGQWAEIDGILYDRHSFGEHGGALYCGPCRRRLLEEHEAALVRAAEAEARAAAARARAEPKEQRELFGTSETIDDVSRTRDTADV